MHREFVIFEFLLIVVFISMFKIEVRAKNKRKLINFINLLLKKHIFVLMLTQNMRSNLASFNININMK